MEKLRVLVTGGAGYVGSTLCERLLNEGWHVTVLDNLLHKQTSLFHLCHRDGLEFVRGDVRDGELMKRLVTYADVIIPLAAIVGMPACRQLDKDTVWEINVTSVKRLIELSSKDQVIVYPTTNSGYGTKTGEVTCTEETPLEPVSLYGESKREAEKLLLNFHPNAVTLRLATVFGPSARMRMDLLVNDFVYQAITAGCLVLFEGGFRRNFVHVLDVADGFVHCIKNIDSMCGRCFNLGLDAANMSKKQLAEKIKEHVKDLVIIESDLRSDPDKRDYIVSNQRLREAGFEAKHSLDEGVRGLMRLYKMLPTDFMRNA